MMKISLITTIFNEEKSITDFLKSINHQTHLPDEVIIVDGGSKDQTHELVSKFIASKSNKLKIKFIIKYGNRSVGRNEAIENSKHNYIAIADAGTKLDKRWLENIISPFKESSVDIVAGYYTGVSNNIFQKSIIPYVLVMPDKVDPQKFLPATRSMAIKKTIWKKVGRFNEKLAHNEDYDFAKKLEKRKAKIYFQNSAVVYWKPEDNLFRLFKMFFRFALGDIEAKIVRPKVPLIFLRYFYFSYMILLLIIYRNYLSLILLSYTFLLYSLWSIKKNYKYVQSYKALFYLPFLQIYSDLAVMSGTLAGMSSRFRKEELSKHIKSNKFILFSLFIYSLFIFLTFTWGIPNQNRIYPYHMDEWHQFQSVIAMFRDGTPNTEGAANGTVFYFLTSGFYLLPFIAIKYISGSVNINDFLLKERIFELLRLNTYIYGIISIFVLNKLLIFLNLKNKIPILLFILSPIFVLLSGYFKYDIALLFWIILSLYFIVKYARSANGYSYLYAGLFAGLAISTKISALPLSLIYVLAFFIFEKSKFPNIKYFVAGIINFIFVVILFGIPDTLFDKGNIYFYLYDNVVSVPQGLSENLNVNPYIYLFLKQYPLIFGYGLIFSLLISLAYILKLQLKGKLVSREMLFIIISGIIFLLSLLPLGLVGTGNRSLVLIPFILIIIAFGITYLSKKRLMAVNLIFGFFVLIQLIQIFGWVSIKQFTSPQESSSSWINKNLPIGAKLGIENIPIYQRLPDQINKEYSLRPYGGSQSYSYVLVDSNSKVLPEYMILSNAETEYKLLKNSPKKLLIDRLKHEGYKNLHSEEINTKYFFFGDKNDYYFSTLIAAPVSVSIYRK